MDDDVWADSSDEEHNINYTSKEEDAGGIGRVEGDLEGTDANDARTGLGARGGGGGRQSDYDKRMAEREWNKLHRQHGVDGYREGIEEAKEAELQHGFDDGFAEGAQIGIKLGRIRGRASALLHALKSALKQPPDGSTPKLEASEALVKALDQLNADLASITYDDLFPEDHFKNMVSSSQEGGVPSVVTGQATQESQAARAVETFATRLGEIETALLGSATKESAEVKAGTA